MAAEAQFRSIFANWSPWTYCSGQSWDDCTLIILISQCGLSCLHQLALNVSLGLNQTWTSGVRAGIIAENVKTGSWYASGLAQHTATRIGGFRKILLLKFLYEFFRKEKEVGLATLCQLAQVPEASSATVGVVEQVTRLQRVSHDGRRRCTAMQHEASATCTRLFRRADICVNSPAHHHPWSWAT